MSTIADLGNGIGFLYVVDPTTVTDIKFSIPNDKPGARAVKALGLQASNIGSNLQAHGTITVGTPSGSGNITSIDISSIKQNKNNISFTVASTPSDIASSIVTEINNTTPGSGYDYTAIAINEVVYLFAPISAGSDANGKTVSVSISANLSVTTTDIDGGSTATDTSYDSNSGYRFFIDASATAVQGTKSGVEITDSITHRGLESAIPIISATISSGAITINRIASIQHIVVDTEGAAGTDDLDSIIPVGFSNGDIIYLVGTNASRVVTVTNSGNIVTQGAVNFDTGNLANGITLYYYNNNWVEQSKSTTAVPDDTQFRTANFPFLSTSGYGSGALTAADNTTDTLTANSSKQKQVVSGTVTLSTGNYEVALSTTGAKAGDTFTIEYNAAVTVGSYDVIIGGITLTDADALTGGIVVEAYYSGSAWQYTANKDYYASALIQTANIAADAVTVAKVEDNLKYELITITVYFDAARTGSNKIKMPYSGTISEIYGIAQKDIVGDSTITPKNNAGTTMGSGTITFSAGDPVDTAYTSTPATNNTFVAGDILSFTTASTTLGDGEVQLSIKVTRS